ncbi:hypothetical protein PMAYCL1PPCAC_27102, partial [Pristionchus mayeri]
FASLCMIRARQTAFPLVQNSQHSMEPPPSYADAVAEDQLPQPPKRLPSQQLQRQHQPSIVDELERSPRPSNSSSSKVAIEVPPVPIRHHPHRGVVDTAPEHCITRGDPFLKFVVIGMALILLAIIKIARMLDIHRIPDQW